MIYSSESMLHEYRLREPKQVQAVCFDSMVTGGFIVGWTEGDVELVSSGTLHDLRTERERGIDSEKPPFLVLPRGAGKVRVDLGSYVGYHDGVLKFWAKERFHELFTEGTKSLFVDKFDKGTPLGPEWHTFAPPAKIDITAVHRTLTDSAGEPVLIVRQSNSDKVVVTHQGRSIQIPDDLFGMPTFSTKAPEVTFE